MAKKILNVATFGLAGKLLKPFGGGKKKALPAPAPVVGANEGADAVTARQEAEKRRKVAMAARSISPVAGSIVSPGSTLGGY